MEKILYKIQTNKIKCKKCGDIIESKHIHDFKMCKCNSVGVDGGHEYLKRIGKEEDYEDLSFVRKLVKITTNEYKVVKSKMKQSEILSQKDIKCPICNSNKIALMKGNGEEIIGCDIIGIICHDCEKIFEFSDIKYKNAGDNDDRKSFN